MPRKQRAVPANLSELNTTPVVTHEVYLDVLDAFKSYLLETENPNTVRAYRSALRYWFAWAAMRLQEDLSAPVPAIAVMTFLFDHVDTLQPDGSRKTTMPAEVDGELRRRKLRAKGKTWSVSWVRLHLAALAKWQSTQKPRSLDGGQEALWVSPNEHPDVLAFMRRLPIQAERAGHVVKKKTAAKLDVLDAMLATCRDDLLAVPLPHARHQRTRELAAIRDRALLWFGWASGGRRRSEIAGAVFDRLTRRDHAPDEEIAFTYRLGRTKTDPNGQAKNPDKPITGDAAVALQAWLEHASITSGPLFRDVSRGTVGAGLTPRAVARIVQRRALAAGIEGNWGGHSLRSGFISEAVEQGIPDAETMKMTDHRSLQSFVDYHQPGELLKTRAGSLAAAARAKKRKPLP